MNERYDSDDNPNPKVFCFDIDGTLCTQTSGDYKLALPIVERIHFVNNLYRKGHVIKLFTARGSRSGLDWSRFTEEQISSWGVLHHELIFGKPHADVFVDDKACNSEDFSWRSRLKSNNDDE